MRDLAERGEHLFQQPEFIKENSEHTSKRLIDLAKRGKHPWQQHDFIKAHSECTSKHLSDLAERGKHPWQQPDYKLEFGVNVKKQSHDLQKLSSGSTEEATYYAIDGADENGRYILIPEIFGTNDLNF